MIVMRKARQGQLASVPSPARIREMTARIRQTWTQRERLRRANQAAFVELLEVSIITLWKRPFED